MAGLAEKGRPGSWGGLVLRACQLAFAAAAFCTIVFSPAFSTFSAFYGLMIAMLGQSLWSFSLVVPNGYALRYGMDLTTNVQLRVFLVGDWVTAVLAFAAQSSSTALVVLLERDMHACRHYPQLACDRFLLATVFAFLAWAFSAASAVVSFWLVAATM